MELLNHFSLTSSGRQYFVQTNIINQIKYILSHDEFIENVCENEELFNADVAIVAYSFLLLCNLSYEKNMFAILKKQDFKNIYSKLQSAKDGTIQFACQTLLTILSQDEIHEDNEPMKLRQMCAEYLEKNIVEYSNKRKSGVVADVEEPVPHVKLRVLNDSFLTDLKQELEELAVTEFVSNALKYKNTGRRVRVVSKQETIEVELLLDPILKCLQSNFYLKSFEKIELNEAKAVSGAMTNNRNLAHKHLLFMRECPEFLFRHDYKQRKEIADTLGRQMLENTTTIFDQHLGVLLGDEGKFLFMS